jgi:hypothetical protein
MKHLKTLLLIGSFVCLGASLMTPKAKADESDQKTILNFEQPVQLPGTVLPAGTYVFKLVKMAMDRDVVQVLSLNETKIYTTIMAVPYYRENATDDTLIVFEERPAGAPKALKEWFFADRRYGHEFVYSKREPAEFAEPAVTTEHSEQIMQPGESDYLRLLHQKQTEPPKLAKADQTGSGHKPAKNAELNYMQLLRQEQKGALK